MTAQKKKLAKKMSLPALVVILLLILNVALGFILTNKASSALKIQIRERMLDVSQTAASMLDGDVLARLTAEDEQTEDYQNIIRALTHFQDNIDLKYIYCIISDGNGGFVFSVDPTVEDPGEFGSPIEYTDALYHASLGTPSVDDEPYTDAWGTFYSAYCPVFTSAGEVGAILAVDMSADWYDEQINSLVRTVVIVAVASLVIGILIVIIATRHNRKQNAVLSGQLNELAIKVRELVSEIEKNESVQTPEDDDLIRTADALSDSDDIDAIGAKIISMQDSIRDHIEIIRSQAFVDGLTGLGNKTAYLDNVKNLEVLIDSNTADFAIAVFDMNGLKHANDNYGHETGDAALCNIGSVLKEVFGEANCFRVGGDEFVAIISEPDPDTIEKDFRLFDSRINEINERADADGFRLAVSKGIAVYDPDSDTGFKAVFARADVAMYEDKRRYYETHADKKRNSQPANTEN